MIVYLVVENEPEHSEYPTIGRGVFSTAGKAERAIETYKTHTEHETPHLSIGEEIWWEIIEMTVDEETE